MKLNRPTILKSLLAIVSALLVALVLQPSSALAVTSVEVNYTTDGNGSVNPDSEKQYSSVSLLVGVEDPYGGSAPYTVDWVDGFLIEGATPLASVVDYEFAYWTANEKVYVPYPNYEDGYWVKCIDAGTAISADEMANKIYVAGDVTFEAHFKSTKPHTVTYTVDGNGEYEPGIETTESVDDGNSPANIPTPRALDSDNYMFANWTASADVILTDDTVIQQGNPLTTAQLKQVKVTSNITFTANFAQKFTVTYRVGSIGYLDPTDETIKTVTEEVASGNSPASVPTPETTNPNLYTFSYWYPDRDVELTDGTKIEAQDEMTPAQLKMVKVTKDITFWAQFNIRCDITYKTDDTCTFPAEAVTTEVVARYQAPANVPTPVPNEADTYVFGYWTADSDIDLNDGSVIAKGNRISIAQMSKISMWSDTTFTAHCRKLDHGVYYKVDENGYYPSGVAIFEHVQDGKPLANVPTPVPNDDTKYVFGYWTADVDVYLADDTRIAKGNQITIAQMSSVVPESDIYFTAHFRDTVHTITYKAGTKGHIETTESTDTATEYVDDLGSLASVPTVISDVDGYPFEGWTADVEVFLSDGTSIAKGQQITTAKMSTIVVYEDITFTAYYPHTPYYQITYDTDGNGGYEGVTGDNPTVKFPGYNYKYLGAPTPYPYDATKFRFAYWVNDESLSFWATAWTPGTAWTYPAGSHFTSKSSFTSWGPLSVNSYGDRKVTLTATFEQIAGDITYEADGPGKVTTSSERINFSSKRIGSTNVMVGSPTGSTPNAESGAVFDYWTASEDVYNATDLSIISAGAELTTEQLQGGILVSKDTTFTAHFTKVYTFTYKAGPHGSVNPTTEVVRADDAPAGPNISPDAGYAFDHWTADEDVEVADATQAIMLTGSEDDVAPQAGTTTIQAGDPITAEQFALIVPTTDATFTANFVRVPPFTVSYTTDGNGSVADESETINEAFDSPLGTEVTANKGFEFDYWTASTDVQIPGEEGGDPITIAQGEKITDEQLKQVLVTDDITFTAHFKQTAVDPDGGDTIKPADGEGGKLTPKTGDTLPASTAAVALGAGVVVAGVALLKKRVR